MDIEINVSVPPAVHAFATLAGQPQALSIRRAARNAGLERLGHAAEPPVFVSLWYRELELQRRAVISLLESDRCVDCVVLARDGDVRAPMPGAILCATQTGEEIGEIDVVEGKSTGPGARLPTRRRTEILPRPVSAQAIVGGAFFRVLQGLVGFGNFLEPLLGVLFLGHVGMEFAREFAVCLLDGVGIRSATYPKDFIIILVFHNVTVSPRQGQIRCR